MSAIDSANAAKDLYRRWIDELWSGQQIANELVSDDFVGHWPNFDVHGPGELHAIVDKTREVLADLKMVVDIKPLVEGDMLAARWIGTGAMADGPKRYTGNDIFRIENGRFVEYWTGTAEG